MTCSVTGLARQSVVNLEIGIVLTIISLKMSIRRNLTTPLCRQLVRHQPVQQCRSVLTLMDRISARPNLAESEQQEWIPVTSEMQDWIPTKRNERGANEEAHFDGSEDPIKQDAGMDTCETWLQ